MITQGAFMKHSKSQMKTKAMRKDTGLVGGGEIDRHGEGKWECGAGVIRMWHIHKTNCKEKT